MKTFVNRVLLSLVGVGSLLVGVLPVAAQVAPSHDVIRVKDVALNPITFGQPLPIAPAETAAQRLNIDSITIESAFTTQQFPMAHANQVGAAIPTATSLVPQPLTPADLLKDPNTAWQRFMAQEPPQPKPFHPLAFFELPALESGLKMNLMNF
jgi:hypothetical protein